MLIRFAYMFNKDLNLRVIKVSSFFWDTLYHEMPNVVVSVAFALCPAGLKLLLGKTRSKAKSVDQNRKNNDMPGLSLLDVCGPGW